MASQNNSTKHTKNLYPSFLNFPKKLKKKEHSQTLAKDGGYEATITLIPKPDKDTTNRKITGQYLWWKWCKDSQFNFSQLNPTTYQKIIYHHQVGFIPNSQGWFNSGKSINVIHHINKSQKPHDHLHRHRKSTWPNPTSIYDKNSYQSVYRGKHTLT